MHAWESVRDPSEPSESQFQVSDETIGKRHFFFLTTEAAELDECQSGAAGAILTTPEGKMIEEDAHTKGERPRHGKNP